MAVSVHLQWQQDVKIWNKKVVHGKMRSNNIEFHIHKRVPHFSFTRLREFLFDVPFSIVLEVDVLYYFHYM